MKPNITPTQQETQLKSEDFIVSKTDEKGIITYCNQIFIDISGYSEEELIGKQHNIIRHPDMPRAVFHLLWETIKKGDEFFGYVKNLRKDGGYYWVYANVTSRISQRQGYHSVRRKPSTEAIETVRPIYADMLAAEKQAGSRNAIAASTSLLNARLADLGTNYEEFSRDY